jgi:nucleoside-diphosphate-sugar epimerase
MKNVIIAGSSGMIGNQILQLCIEHEEVGIITLINRRPSGIKHPKIKEVIHTDFTNLDVIASAFAHQDVCYYCVGVYTGAVPTDEFNKITIDYTSVFGKMLQAHSPAATVCFLSGAGADSTERSKVLFARAKGIAENHLLSLGFPRIYIFRPGYIYPVVPRREPNFAYTLMRWLYCPISAVYANMGVTSTHLAQRMYEHGLDGGKQTILENRDIRQ